MSKSGEAFSPLTICLQARTAVRFSRKMPADSIARQFRCQAQFGQNGCWARRSISRSWQTFP